MIVISWYCNLGKIEIESTFISDLTLEKPQNVLNKW